MKVFGLLLLLLGIAALLGYEQKGENHRKIKKTEAEEIAGRLGVAVTE